MDASREATECASKLNASPPPELSRHKRSPNHTSCNKRDDSVTIERDRNGVSHPSHQPATEEVKFKTLDCQNKNVNTAHGTSIKNCEISRKSLDCSRMSAQNEAIGSKTTSHDGWTEISQSMTLADEKLPDQKHQRENCDSKAEVSNKQALNIFRAQYCIEIIDRTLFLFYFLFCWVACLEKLFYFAPCIHVLCLKTTQELSRKLFISIVYSYQECLFWQDALVVSDIEDSDIVACTPHNLQANAATPTLWGDKFSGDAVSQADMHKLHTILWGSSCSPPSSWKQGFYFCQRKTLTFGLVQKRGGPCGALAAVQAQILAYFWPNVSRETIFCSANRLIYLMNPWPNCRPNGVYN